VVLFACPVMHLFHRHHGAHRHPGGTVSNKEKTP
jgi:hypothetical protein